MENIRVLLITSSFRWYSECYVSALKKLGVSFSHINASVVVGKKDYYGRVKQFLGLNVDIEKEKTRKKIESDALRKFAEINANVVILTLGNQLSRETLNVMKRKAVIINLFGDTLAQYPYVKSIADCFDLFYSYEMTDVEYLNTHNIKCKPLMGLADEKQYFPKRVDKSIDVSFVGAFYKNRRDVLERLYLDFPDKKLEFWGRYVGLKKPIDYLIWAFSKKRKVFKNRVIHYSKVNEIYNRSKICLNINGYQTKNGWSSRLVEIALSKSCQIVDFNESIAKNFADCTYLYKTYDELVDGIKKLLENENERERMANELYQRVLRNYTYEKAMKSILSDAQNMLILKERNKNE